MRRALLALLVAMSAAGCGTGGAVVGEAHFDDVTTRELPLRVRITGVTGDWASSAVLADVVAPGAEWVAMDLAEIDPGLGPSAGPVRRTVEGAVQLEREADWFSPASCEEGVCELELVLRLDAPPAEPWSASVFVTVEGETDGATVEIEAR
jgi:hypothetical protein